MEDNSGQWGVGLVIGILIGMFIGSSFGPSSGAYEAALSQCNVVRDDYVSALESAQASIDEANSQLTDAQWYAWSSYDEMGTALDSLYEVDEADDPGTICL